MYLCHLVALSGGPSVRSPQRYNGNDIWRCVGGCEFTQSGGAIDGEDAPVEPRDERRFAHGCVAGEDDTERPVGRPRRFHRRFLLSHSPASSSP